MGWVEPTSHSDPDDWWYSEANGYGHFDDDGHHAYSVYGKDNGRLYLYLSSAINTSKCTIRIKNGTNNQIDLGVNSSPVYPIVCRKNPPSSPTTYICTYSQRSVDALRVDFNVALYDDRIYLYGVKLWEDEAPTVITEAASNIGFDRATGNGDITIAGTYDDAGALITEHGVCWKKGADPVNIAGADGYSELGTGSEGAFASEMTGLDNESTYYYRAYATNSEGTSYGAAQSFYVHKTLVDSGVAFDSQPSIQAGFVVADQGVGSSTLEISKDFTLQDVASGIDTPVIAATLPLIQDSGGPGIDSVAWARAISVSDTGAGIDATALQIAFSLTDVGTGAEIITTGTAIIPISDFGAGVDSIATILAQISIADSSVGQEVLGILAQIGITDVGNIQDWLTLVKAFIAIADTGAGAEGDLTVNNWIPKVAIDVQYPEESDIEYSMD